MKKEGKGITLIAMIITIIILLILASVSILTLINTGLFEKAKEAKEKTEISTEEEYLKLIITTNMISNKDNYILGKKLYDKTIENGNRWNVIIMNDTNKIYGTDWNYIEKGTTLEDYGEAKYNWVINYETGETIKIKDNSYTQLSYDTSLGSTKGLIFNMDASIIEGAETEEMKNNYKSLLGENTELVNFDWNDESGLNNKGFNLDGVDDYIKVKYDTEEEKQILADDGFTFEYYGITDSGTKYYNGQQTENPSYNGIFCYWNGNEDKQARFRFGSYNNGKRIIWNAGFRKVESDYSHIEGNALWNIYYPDIAEFEYENEKYLTITVDCSNSYIKDGVEYYKQTLYCNGEKRFDGGYNKEAWQAFIQSDLEELNYFCIGRSSMTNDGEWYYSKMNVYAVRLYNRALTEEEVTQNYNKSVAYHNTLN